MAQHRPPPSAAAAVAAAVVPQLLAQCPEGSSRLVDAPARRRSPQQPGPWPAPGDPAAAPSLCPAPRRSFGGRKRFYGKVVTLQLPDSHNSIVSLASAEPGEGRIMVVDNAASMRAACLGDAVASRSHQHGGWHALFGAPPAAAAMLCTEVQQTGQRDLERLMLQQLGLGSMGPLPQAVNHTAHTLLVPRRPSNNCRLGRHCGERLHPRHRHDRHVSARGCTAYALLSPALLMPGTLIRSVSAPVPPRRKARPRPKGVPWSYPPLCCPLQRGHWLPGAGHQPAEAGQGRDGRARRRGDGAGRGHPRWRLAVRRHGCALLGGWELGTRRERPPFACLWRFKPCCSGVGLTLAAGYAGQRSSTPTLHPPVPRACLQTA